MKFSALSDELKKELANSLSHGFGLLIGLVSVPVLIATACIHSNIPGVVGASVFGFSFLMLYTFSTLYHSFQQPALKRVMRLFDHISIYFLIAGSYTPFILCYLFDATGIALLAVLWGLAGLGTLYKIFFLGKYESFSLVIYLSMGWALVFLGDTFFSKVPEATLWMIGIGGALYTLGVVFFVWTKLFYHHAIWHGFVLAGSLCHYVAVLLSVS